MRASTWSVIVPVKSAANAKTRLADEYGAWRPHLARAFALDTIGAAADCTRTASVVVVTDDEELGAILAAREHMSVVADDGAGDVNAAIRIALASLPGYEPVAVITSDLPSLTGPGLAVALDLAAGVPVGVVADREGVGTTMLAARSASLRPQFGANSLRRHVRGGAVELGIDRAAAIRRDVDVPDHLEAAMVIGVGPATAQVVERMRNGARPKSGPAPQPMTSSDVNAYWQLPSS